MVIVSIIFINLYDYIIYIINIIIYIFIYYMLYRTKGDDNCLYRACSKLLCEKAHVVLRDLTSIELFTNQEFYAFHPYIKEMLISSNVKIPLFLHLYLMLP